MELRDVVRRRRMVRRFTDRPVDPSVVDRALDHATRAPSAGFTQGWAFVVLDTPADVRRYWEATVDPTALAAPDRWLAGMLTAPVLVVPCSSRAAYLDRYARPDKGWGDRDPARWSMPYWHLDTAMAALLVLLTAVDEGLGACFFGIPVERVDAACSALGIPTTYDPIGVVALGHPDPATRTTGSPTRRARRPLDEVVHRGRWQGG